MNLISPVSAYHNLECGRALCCTNGETRLSVLYNEPKGTYIPVRIESTDICAGISESFFANVKDDLKISLACPGS